MISKKSIELLNAEDVSEWAAECQQKISQGVKLIRLHLLDTPCTPYMEWELECYKHINIPKCGEAVFLVNRADAAGLKIPDGDLMIFDNRGRS